MSFKLKLPQWYEQKQRGLILHAIMNTSVHNIKPGILQKIKTKYKNDTQIIGKSLLHGIINLNDVTKELKQDINIIIEALKRDASSLKYVDEKFRNDLKLIRLVVNHNPEVLRYASQDVRDTKEVFTEWIKVQPAIIYYLGPVLKKDVSFINYLLGRNPKAYQYLADDLKTDKTLALSIVKRDFSLIQYMNKDLQNDLNLLLTACYYARTAIHTKTMGTLQVENKKPFYFDYVIKTEESQYMYMHRNVISESTFPLIKEALLKNSASVMNPPAGIKILIDGAEDKFLLLAQYALSEELNLTNNTELPENLLS